MNKKPFLSIAIPTYEFGGRGVEFLEFSFEKMLKQTFKDFEVVISDHSLNNDIELLCQKWSNDLKINYIKNDIGRGGISPNINVAMDNCVGEYIKILFQDDFLYDEFSLQNTYEFIKNNDDLIWLATDFYHTNDGIKLERPLHPTWNDRIWIGNNTIGCPTVITIKNENIMHFDNNMIWLNDVDFYKRMFDKWGLPHICDKFTVVNRTWGGRLSDTTKQDVIHRETKMVIERYAY